MSPLTVRRYRAERMLRKEFEVLRGKVLGTVRGRLRASGVSLDTSDLEACYAEAWQGLYAAMLAGEEIANPTGWLALVTFRRAIEEHRSRRRSYPTEGVGGADGPSGRRGPGDAEAAREHDFAGELDDRTRLRQLFEGLRGRLSAREQEAAALCYLQGLSRAEAAGRMGISEARMRKLMEGPGQGRPGVAGKVGELVETIRGGGWCEEQGSLMRGLAFGVLDPEGERYQLALAHQRQCPACRNYILSLRGLAAVLPPTSLPLALGVGAVAGAGATGVGAGAGAVGVGGATGGGWLLAGGPVGAKLAVGCLLALGVGASCVALGVNSDHRDGRHAELHRRRAAGGAGSGSARAVEATSALSPGYLLTGAAAKEAQADDVAALGRPVVGSAPALSAAGKASREFGPEHALAGTSSSSSSSTPKALSAIAASSGGRPVRSGSGSSTGAGAPTARAASAASQEFSSTAAQSPTATQARTRSSTGSSSGGAASTGGNAAQSAQREFGIG
jgi:DNA-directed RNA polymerase specialized sigma24 family protein